MTVFQLLALEQSQILLWVLLAIAIVALAALVFKFVSMYRNMKREKATREATEREEAIAEGVEARLAEMRGEYLVIARNVMVSVGEEGQIREGRYLLKGADGLVKFNVRLNGLVREFSEGDVVALSTGDTLCPVSGAIMVKPYVE